MSQHRIPTGPISRSASLPRRAVFAALGLLAWLHPVHPAIAQSPPALYTPAATFAAADHYVATTVFHWYTPTGGQRSGPWLPLENRENWTGEPAWWKSQVKQMMSANIDVLYVHLIPSLEAQRRNLFIALDQLRAEGYDTPKVAPFLDPLITWDQQPLVDLATAAGKDEFVGQYIRFFEQYFAASSGADADDYIATQDGKPILDTWHVHLNCANVASLTRADVANRLSAAFAAEHPVFANGFVMVTTALNPPTLSFADEKVPQFEINQHYSAFTHNTVQSVQLKGGYWDQNVRNPGDFLARAGGVPYRAAWEQVNRATTRRVYIESWNEYDEGTGIYAAQNTPHIAPANTSGNTDTWSTSADPFEYIKTTAQGAAAFNDVPAQDAIVLWHNLPATMTPGETRTATVIVRNVGDASWTAAAGYQLGQANADTAFVTGRRVQLDDTKDEIPLYGGIFRGRAKVFQVNLTAPAALATYTTHWRMAQDGGASFGEELTVPIQVKNKAAALITLGHLTQQHDGTPRAVSALTLPAGLAVDITYDGSPYPPTNVGTYAVVATIDDPNYRGNATGTLVVTVDPNLVAAAGGFESLPLGSTVTSPPDVVDGTTFAGWRAFNVVSANVSFSATVVSDASAGLRAMRLHATNATGASNYALDQWQPEVHTDVQQGTDYFVSFDAVWIAGATANNLLFQVQEFNAAGVFLRNGLSELRSIGSTDYQTHTFNYRPVDPAAAEIGLFFGPMRGATGTTTVVVDSIKLVRFSDGPAPAIGIPPLTQTVTAGGGVTLTTEASGIGPFTYQWFRDNVALSGATAASYTLPSLQEFQAGSYTVQVANPFGTTTSAAAVLTVNAPAANNARLLNLSTRGLAQSGANVLIPGFVIEGAATKKLLIRAVGPSLGDLGVPFAVVPDPQMQLKRLDFSTQPPNYVDVSNNDDWITNANAAEITTLSAALGAFALTDDKDAALLIDLPAGQYSVTAGDNAGISGIAIVELYDADATGAGARLINISNRGFVGVGDQVMIPGFVVSSEGPKTLLVRVVGPALIDYGVPGTMADPKLTFFRTNPVNGQNTELFSQDNWSESPDAAQTAQIAQQLGAFALDDGSADAAFVVTLEPGVYTVVGSSADGVGTGVVLVEVYVVP